MTKFRFHRRMLDESLETQVDVDSKEQLVDLIKNKAFWPNEKLKDIKIEYYCYDDRINWDTWIVMVNGYPIGFTDGDLK